MNLNVVFVLWRELFEAVLIVAIVQAFAAKRLPPARGRLLVFTGVGLGLGLSAAVGLAFQWAQEGLPAAVLEHFQTGALIACALLMTHMVVWMKKHARTLKKELETSLEGALSSSDAVALVALIALAIAREGFEVVVFLYGMGLAAEAQGSGFSSLAVSAAAGAVLAGMTAYGLFRGIKVVNQRLFFKFTGIFLLITAASMLITAVMRLLQSGAVPALVDQVWDTSVVLDDRGGFGRFVASVTGYQSTPALITVLVYFGYWAAYWLFSRRVGAVAAAAAAVMLSGAPAEAAPTAPADKLKLKFTGYGDMQLAWYDHGPNRNLQKGAAKDSRATLDATRFVARLEGFYLPYDVEFEAEVEFEHGGTGTALELEYEEFGEFEPEVEKGGEVLLEEFYLKKILTNELTLRAGRIPVAMGLVSSYRTPIDYLGARRSEAETHLLPESWMEMGLDAFVDLETLKIRAQVINGLDSSGFSSQFFVSSGYQQRFELVRASDPAGVLRFDYTGFGSSSFGVSGYHGGTTRNRPQADLVKSCNEEKKHEVAPCGYVEAPVTLVDVHGTLRLENVRGAGAVIWGKLENAGRVSERNRRLSNALDVLRTPVADEAFGAWAELGYDLAPALGLADGRKLEPFVRYDSYDTMAKTKSGQVDNPRFERRLATLGTAYSIDQALFGKLEASRRSFGLALLRPEITVTTSLGFIF